MIETSPASVEGTASRDLRREATSDKVDLDERDRSLAAALEGEEFLADDLRRTLPLGMVVADHRRSRRSTPGPHAVRRPKARSRTRRNACSSSTSRVATAASARRRRDFGRYPQRGLLAQVDRLHEAVSRHGRAHAVRRRRDETPRDGRHGGGTHRARGAVRRRSGGERREGPPAPSPRGGRVGQRRSGRAPPGRGRSLYARIPALKEAFAALRSEATDEGYAMPGPASGGFVVLDAESGAVLAWADTPMFDLNDSLEDVVTKLEDDEEAQARRDAGGRTTPSMALAPDAGRGPALACLRIMVEPGSSMKISTVLALPARVARALREDYFCYGPERPGEGPELRPTEVPRPSEPRRSRDRSHVLLQPLVRGHGVRPPYLQENRDAAPHVGRAPGHRQAHRASTWAVDLPGAFPTPAADSPGTRAAPPGQHRAVDARDPAPDGADRGVRRERTGSAHSAAGRVGRRTPRPGRARARRLRPAALARVRAGMRGCVTDSKRHRPREVRPPRTRGRDGLRQDRHGDRDRGLPPRRGWRRTTGGPCHLWFVGYSSKPGTRTLAFAMVLHARKEQGASGGGIAAPAVARFLAWWYTHDPR